MNHNKNDVVLQVERALSHILAHDLNNALGAIDVLAGMLAEDASDAPLYTNKIQMAARLGRSQVHALRMAVPKPGEGHEVTKIKDAIAAVKLMMGDNSARVITDQDDVGVMPVPVGVATYVFYHLITHVVGCVTGDVTGVYDSAMTFKITGTGDIVPPLWPTPLWDVIMVTFGLSIEVQANGFVLQWPAAAL